MAGVNVTLSNVTITHSDGSTESGVTIVGEAGYTDLGVGGGPVFPPPDLPIDPGKPPHPVFPIWGPPGIELPPGEGYPPVAGHPLPPIPPGGGTQPPSPPMFIPIWHPIYGWIVIPTFPVPTPSKGATQTAAAPHKK